MDCWISGESVSMCGIRIILPCSNNWFISLELWVGLLLTDCKLSSCFIQSVSMDWSDDICFLCARMAPSICCLYLINKPINEWRERFFRIIIYTYTQSWFENLPEIFYLSSHYWRLLCQFSDLFSTTTYWRRHFSNSWKPYTLENISCDGKRDCLFRQLLYFHCSTTTCFVFGSNTLDDQLLSQNDTTLGYWRTEQHSDILPPTVYCANNTGHDCSNQAGLVSLPWYLLETAIFVFAK